MNASDLIVEYLRLHDIELVRTKSVFWYGITECVLQFRYGQDSRNTIWVVVNNSTLQFNIGIRTAAVTPSSWHSGYIGDLHDCDWQSVLLPYIAMIKEPIKEIE